MKQIRTHWVLGLVAAGALAVPVLAGIAQNQELSVPAQDRPPIVGPGQQGGPPPGAPGPVPGQPGRPGVGGQMPFNPGMGGGAVMVDDERFLYILQGSRLLKVDKATLEVTKQANLPRVDGPRPAGERGTPPGGPPPQGPDGETQK